METCEKRQDKVAFVYKDQQTTYRELLERVNQMSGALIEQGIEPGDRISVLPSTCPEFLYLYFATLQIGGVINPINLLWGVAEIKAVLERNDPKLIVTVDGHRGRDYIHLLREALPDLSYVGDQAFSSHIPSLRNLMAISFQNKQHDGFADFHQLLSQAPDRTEEIAQRRKQQTCTDLQYICQTSGSTGISKSARWDHRAPLASANFVAKNLSFTENDSYLNLSPFFHNGGLVAINMTLAYAGATLYFLEYFDPQKAVEAIREHNITATLGFAAHWQGMKRQPAFSTDSFSIRKAIVAGDPKTVELVREMCGGEEATVCTLYAQTEGGPFLSLSEYDCLQSDINKYTNGRPFPGVEVVIKDVDSQERLAEGIPGEICYKSPFMFKEYYHQPEATSQAFDEEGYFHSGDFGIFKNGYITYLGRLGGVVKSGGENVSTLRVSMQLLELFTEELDDVQTLGVADDYWGAKVVSWIRWKAGKAMPTKQFREACKGKLADYEIPKEVLVWEGEWPMTAEGKIDVRKLTAAAKEQLSC